MVIGVCVACDVTGCSAMATGEKYAVQGVELRSSDFLCSADDSLQRCLVTSWAAGEARRDAESDDTFSGAAIKIQQ